MAEKTVALPAFHARADVTENSYDEATNSIELVWSTGAKVRRYSWRDSTYYDEVLILKPNSVRLDRLNAGAPLLDTHGRWSLDDVIGSVMPGSAKIRDGRGVARVRLSSAPKDADRVQKIKDGTVRNVSVGYLIHRVEKSEPAEGGVAEWRVVDWEPIEISAVPVPADPGSQFRGQQQALPLDAPQSLCVFDETREEPTHDPAAAGTTESTTMTTKNTAANSERTEEAARTEPVAVTTAAPAAPAVDASAQARAINEAASTAAAAAVTAERERAEGIRAVAAPFGLRDIADEHIGKATTVEQFRAIAMDELAKRTGSDTRTDSTTRASAGGPADPEKRALAIENALMHRADPAGNKLTDDGRDFRGMSLIELGRDALEVAGTRTRGMPKLEIASRALSLGQYSVRSGGLMSTSDFSAILANVAHKTLRRAYEAAGQTFRPLVFQTTVPDFKEVSRTQLGEAPTLEKVNEHGEFKRGSMGEGAEKYRVETFGKIVGITRQVIVNDDLNAFTRIPRSFGVQAAQLESDLVWAEIIGNPVMGDGKTLFHADHSNLVTPAATIAVASVGKGREQMAKQTGLDNKTVLNLTAAHIVGPVALQTLMEQFLNQIWATKTADVVPATMKNLTPITEPRLDNGIPRFGIAGSATAWYLAANPAQVDVVELAYLEGTEGVYTESRVGFEVDGVEVKVRMDVGAKVIDHRGLQKNAGA